MDKRIQLEIRPYRFSKPIYIYVGGLSEESINRLEERHKPERVLYQLADGTRKWKEVPKIAKKKHIIKRT